MEQEELNISVVIPVKDEAQCIASTLSHLHTELRLHQLSFELLVVNDHSADDTPQVLESLKPRIPELRVLNSPWAPGFGNTVRYGLQAARGTMVTIVMADESDDPRDVVHYWRAMQDLQVECIFGSRFIRGGGVIDYPPHKYVLNRLANWFIQLLFGISLNDTTNAFKAYRRAVIEGVAPLISKHFNLTVELPLKAIVRGYSWQVIPITWRNRKHGVSKLRIKEMGSRYLFMVCYILLEKLLSCGDYHRNQMQSAPILKEGCDETH